MTYKNMNKIIIGTNEYRGIKKTIAYKDDDRLRHMYMIGKTGVGKSTIFQNMCLQDIQNGHGVCYVDPHGESIDWLLEHIPKERIEDVILFDPSDMEYPFGLNILEASSESEKDFVVNECIQIFYKLFDPEKTGIIGPQFEHWLRNAALTVMAGPEGGSIIEIPKLFIDKEFELKKRKLLTNSSVIEFWTKQMSQTSDFHKSEMLNYFMSKFGQFINNTLVRNIIGQRKSSFDLEKLMDNKKILLVNLSKGKIGEINAHMLGLIMIAKLQVSILRRANQDISQRLPFYLYVDEFQNFTTDTFISMLSESRKYGLGVHITNQYLSQLPINIKNAVLGNVGTTLVFEVGAEDAELLSKEFEPFEAADFMNLPKFNFYMKLMIDGKTSQAFSGTSSSPENFEKFEKHRQLIEKINKLTYAHPKILVEKIIYSNLL